MALQTQRNGDGAFYIQMAAPPNIENIVEAELNELMSVLGNSTIQHCAGERWQRTTNRRSPNAIAVCKKRTMRRVRKPPIALS